MIAQTDFKKTEVLILGTPHLAQMKDFEPNMLKNVIRKLDLMKFDVICVENMSGQLLYDIKSRKDSAFDGVTKGRWGGKRITMADTIRKKLGVSFVDAQQKIEEILKKEELSVIERKKLMYHFISTTDVASASLQYRYIKEKVDLFTSDLDKYVERFLVEKSNSTNEVYSLALNLAYNQKLNKIDAVNDFQDEALLYKHFPDFILDYKNNSSYFSSIGKEPVYQKTKELTRVGMGLNDLSELYLFLNSKKYMEQDFNAQWKIWLQSNFPSGSDRARFSLWEMRNLQISANILKVSSFHPGKKILVIIGSSHKGFLEKYLNQITDIKLLTY
jgi:pheromone shutdown protein TraB